MMYDLMNTDKNSTLYKVADKYDTLSFNFIGNLNVDFYITNSHIKMYINNELIRFIFSQAMNVGAGSSKTLH